MEVYLTKMILNPRSRRVHFEISNPQELHRTISGGFPKVENKTDAPHHERETPRNKFDILHRLEFDRRTGRAVLLVQSTARPDWSNLREGYLAEDAENNLACKSIGENYSRIEEGMNLLFCLQANPTKRIGKSDAQAAAKFKEYEKGSNRRRVELRSDAEKIEWLKRKGAGAGFRLADVKIKNDVENAVAVSQGKISFGKSRNSPLLTFGSVVFEGILQVTDAGKFRESLIAGIGTGKSYGFGLLSIAPAN